MRLYPEITKEITKMTIEGKLEWKDITEPNSYYVRKFQCIHNGVEYELYKLCSSWRVYIDQESYLLNRFYRIDRLLIKNIKKSAQQRPSFRDIAVREGLNKLTGEKPCFVNN